MKKTYFQRQKGSLLAAAVIIIVGLAAFGLSAIRTVTTRSTSSSLSLMSYQSFYLAQSGLEYAKYQIKNNISYSNPSAYCDGNWKTAQAFGEGEFQFRCGQYTPSITTATAITSSSKVIPVSSLTNVAALGRVQIDSEQIDYASTSTDSTICGTAPCLVVRERGANNTTAAAHSAATTVTQNQLVIESRGGVPSLTNPNATKTVQSGIVLSYQTYTNAWAVGESGAIYQRVNGVWQKVTPSPSTTQDFNDIACSSSTDCWIVGNNEKLYRWNGSTWTEYTGASIIGFGVALKSIACTSSSDCWLITGNELLYRWNGTNWSYNNIFPQTLNNITCVNSSFCLIAANNGNIYRWNGSTWSSMSTGTTRDLYAVSCPSSTLCYAVGEDGRIIKMTGSSWTIESSPTSHDLITVSCADAGNCWAFGSNRDRNAHYVNGAWVVETVAVSNKFVQKVYCPVANECFMAMNRMDANTPLIGRWNGASWANDSVQSGSAETLLSTVADKTTSGSTLQLREVAWREVFN